MKCARTGHGRHCLVWALMQRHSILAAVGVKVIKIWMSPGIFVDRGSREAMSPVVHVRLAEQPEDASWAQQAL